VPPQKNVILPMPKLKIFAIFDPIYVLPWIPSHCTGEGCLVVQVYGLLGRRHQGVQRASDGQINFYRER
jgi:hypothetical protein